MSITFFIWFHNVAVKCHVIYTVFCLLLSFFGYGYFWYCVVSFLEMCHLYCFQFEHCLLVHCGCMFCFPVSGIQIILECLLQDLSFCVCLTDPGGIAQRWSVLSLHTCCSRWSVILSLLCVLCMICCYGYCLLFLLLYHGSMVSHPHIEPLQ